MTATGSRTPWEAPDGGVDTDGDGEVDLKLSDFGATPDKPDVFVQVGWGKSGHMWSLLLRRRRTAGRRSPRSVMCKRRSRTTASACTSTPVPTAS